MAGALDLRMGPRGLRHYLDGDPIHAGDILEIRMPDGSWLRGRYEWAFRIGAPSALYVMFGERGAWMEIRVKDVLRWPGREEPAPEEGR